MTDRTNDRQQQDRDRLILSVPEAAERLGVTPDAVRARLHRGTLAGEKVGGAWRVFVANAAEPTGTQQDATVDRQETDRPATEALIVRLEAENAYLRQTLDAEIEARRRADHLVAALMDRLPELPAGETAQDAPRTQNTAPPARETAADALGALRAWWRRMRGG